MHEKSREAPREAPGKRPGSAPFLWEAPPFRYFLTIGIKVFGIFISGWKLPFYKIKKGFQLSSRPLKRAGSVRPVRRVKSARSGPSGASNPPDLVHLAVLEFYSVGASRILLSTNTEFLPFTGVAGVWGG